MPDANLVNHVAQHHLELGASAHNVVICQVVKRTLQPPEFGKRGSPLSTLVKFEANEGRTNRVQVRSNALVRKSHLHILYSLHRSFVRCGKGGKVVNVQLLSLELVASMRQGTLV